MRFCWVQVCPAVSTMHTSAAVSIAFATKRGERHSAGSVPWASSRTISAPRRCAQIVNCSTAAAREGVRRTQHHACRRRGTCALGLGDRRRLARAVDSTDHDHGGAAWGNRRFRRLLHQFLEFLLDAANYLRRFDDTRPETVADIIHGRSGRPGHPCRS